MYKLILYCYVFGCCICFCLFHSQCVNSCISNGIFCLIWCLIDWQFWSYICYFNNVCCLIFICIITCGNGCVCIFSSFTEWNFIAYFQFVFIRYIFSSLNFEVISFNCNLTIFRDIFFIQLNFHTVCIISHTIFLCKFVSDHNIICCQIFFCLFNC